MQLKILSWNIWGGQHLPEIIELLRRENPDVIGLQEVIEDLDGTNNTAKEIAAALGYEWFFVPTREVETVRLYTLLEPKTVKMGNAVLSRHKIVGAKTHKLSEEKPRFAVETVIVVVSRSLHIFSTHLIHDHLRPPELRDLQARNLLAIVPKEDAILMGDFNVGSEGSCVQIVAQEMVNTDSELEPTWSVYPEGCPVCLPQKIDARLDYIFTS